MKICFGLILLLFICTSSFAVKSQPQPIDIHQSLKAAIDHDNEVVYSIYLGSPDSARNLAEHALLVAEKIKYQHGIAQSYYNIGIIYWSQSYLPIALFYMNSAIAGAKGDPLLLSEVYSGLGRTYADLGDYKTAITYLEKCEKYAGNDKLSLAEAFSERSYVYLKQHNYNEAIQASKASLKLNLQVGELQGAAIIYSRLGSIYYQQKRYKEALAYDDTAYNNSVKFRMKRLEAGMYNEYATVNNDLHQYDTAIKFAKKGIALFDSIGVMKGLADGYKIIIAGYEAKNDLKSALHYERRYNQTQDSLNMVDKTKSTQLIQNYFKLNDRLNNLAIMEKRNEDNRSKIAFQHTVINILIAVLFFVLAVLSITYYYYKQKNLLSKRLQEQHDELTDKKTLIEIQASNLEDVNSLKNKMLAVIGHDLRTPIANLHNILELFEGEYLTADEVHVLMRDVSPVVKGAELTLSNLLDWAGNQLQGRSIERSNIDVFLLGAEMEQTFRHLLKQKQLEFNNKAKPGQLVFADENHVKIILRNLISNAIKFTGNNGTITLATATEHNRLIISIEDTGTGMTPAQIKKLFSSGIHLSESGTLGEVGTGLGLLLCTELLELNDSKLEVTSVPGQGSKFYFGLPLA